MPGGLSFEALESFADYLDQDIIESFWNIISHGGVYLF